MTADDWQGTYSALSSILSRELGGAENCSEVIDHAEQLMASLWRLTARLWGDGGTKAVLVRASKLAAPGAPLLEELGVRDTGVDFGKLRDYVARTGCQTAEVLDALGLLNVMVFKILWQIGGDVITEPLLRHLQEE